MYEDGNFGDAAYLLVSLLTSNLAPKRCEKEEKTLISLKRLIVILRTARCFPGFGCLYSQMLYHYWNTRR